MSVCKLDIQNSIQNSDIVVSLALLQKRPRISVGLLLTSWTQTYVASMLRLELALLSPRRMCYEKFGAWNVWFGLRAPKSVFKKPTESVWNHINIEEHPREKLPCCSHHPQPPLPRSKFRHNFFRKKYHILKWFVLQPKSATVFGWLGVY